MNRRAFLASASAAVSNRVLGANKRLAIGFIGLGGRARWLLKNEEFPDADIVAVADCDLPRCDEAAKQRESARRWNKYQDYRRMFDKEKLDAVFVETTTHARALIAVHAMQAGLDVYAEKPLTLTVAEGRTLVKAARRYQRVLTTGTQQRSMPRDIYASKLVREGAIGKIRTVIACNFLAPAVWQPKPGQPQPDGLDWDQWCNQTELRPYHKDLQLKWALWRDYDGGGQSWGVSGWGAHSLDQVQCALGTDLTGPVEISPDGSGPECKVNLRYSSGTVLKLEQPMIKDHQQLGAIFVGEKGRIQIVRGDFTADPPELMKGGPEPTIEGAGEMRYHIADFFDCIRSRKRPTADVEIGHRSSTVCHLVNICRELGRRLRWDPEAEKFVGDAEADRLLERPRRKGFEFPAV